MFKKIGEERAFDGILKQIIENIQTGRLKAGDGLPAERTMAETMGVSRAAVREVLRASGASGNSERSTGRRKLYHRGSGYVADWSSVYPFSA